MCCLSVFCEPQNVHLANHCLVFYIVILGMCNPQHLAKDLIWPLCIFLELLEFGIPAPKFCYVPKLYALLFLLTKTDVLCLCAIVLKMPPDRKTGRSSCSVHFVYFLFLRDHSPGLPFAQDLKPFVSNIFYSFILHCLWKADFICYCLMAKTGTFCITLIEIFVHMWCYGIQTVKVMDLIFSAVFILQTII